ncbi:NACHT domain-containing protein [Streptomyces sp. NPDC127108]|uniref:NACHT domain-containing protein n=1 Tax=Streptomyces sp. NPDC127108 TaxID=3345361 RepID=UPI003632A576
MTTADIARGTLTAASLGDAPAGWFENQPERGRRVVPLDSLDEVADPYARQRLVQWTEAQIARYPGNHGVLTTRPQGYDVAPLNGAEALVVRRFTPDQTSRFVHGWYAATASATTACWARIPRPGCISRHGHRGLSLMTVPAYRGSELTRIQLTARRTVRFTDSEQARTTRPEKQRVKSSSWLP